MCVISLFWERNLTFASSNNYSFLKGFFVWKRKVGYLLGVFYEGVLTELCLYIKFFYYAPLHFSPAPVGQDSKQGFYFSFYPHHHFHLKIW